MHHRSSTVKTIVPNFFSRSSVKPSPIHMRRKRSALDGGWAGRATYMWAIRRQIGKSPDRARQIPRSRQKASSAQLEKRTRRTWRAMVRCSSVAITRTVQRAALVLITASDWSLRRGSSAIPRYPSRSQISLRTGTACSPIPPVKTSVSSPPMTAASAPIALRA